MADPDGMLARYNWETGEYEDENEQPVYWQHAENQNFKESASEDKKMLRVIGSEFYDYGDLDGVVIHGKKVEVGTAFWNMYGRGEDPFSGSRADEIRSWYNAR